MSSDRSVLIKSTCPSASVVYGIILSSLEHAGSIWGTRTDDL